MSFQGVNSLSRCSFFVWRGGSALGLWAMSVVKRFTGDERSEAYCKPGSVEGANSSWVEAWAGDVLTFALDGKVSGKNLMVV